jgi:sulfite oxidase
VKWVQQITVQANPSDNYYQATGYRLLPADADPAAAAGDGISLGPFAVNADILAPGEHGRVPAGPVTVSGYALAGDDRRVVRVDISADEGRSWRQARLGEELSPWSWRRWEGTLDLAPGPAEVTARAWDSAASVQPESAAQLWNPKGYANNAWARLSFTVTDPAVAHDQLAGPGHRIGPLYLAGAPPARRDARSRQRALADPAHLA